MERWSPDLVARSHFNMTLNTSTVHEVPWTATNETLKLILNLRLAQVQTLRTMHVTLGGFSLALALLAVHRILSDARRVSAVQVHLRKPKFHFLTNVHPAETFPLVLSSGIIISEIIFIGVQSSALNSFIVDTCRGIAMVLFPTIFLMGYINLVFGIEMAIRSVRKERFAPRGKWNTSICIAVIAFMLLLTWIPTIVWPMTRHCFASLIWFPIRYEFVALVLISIMIFSFLALAALISIQLMRTVKVDPNERISASRMCYYLIIATIIYALVLPFEIQAHRRDFSNSLATARIAEVPLFTAGVFVAFIHLFLRVNASRMMIKPVGSSGGTKQKRPRIRFFGPSDLEMNISGPMMNRPNNNSQEGLIGPEKERMLDGGEDFFLRPEKQPSEVPRSPAAVASPRGPIDPSKWPLPPNPVQTQFFNAPKTPTTQTHKRAKSSYSLFPTRAEEVPRLPATVYSPPAKSTAVPTLAARRQTRSSVSTNAPSVTDVHEASLQWLAAPPPLFSTQRHRREESSDSSATVQIGLRFSVAPAAIVAANSAAMSRVLTPPPIAPPLLRRADPSDSSGDSLGLPIQVPSNGSSPPRPSRQDNPPSPPPQAPPPAITSPSKGFPEITPQNSGSYLQAARDKVLPPTPRGSTVPAPPPLSTMPPLRQPMGLNGLRMNPMSPRSPPKSASTRSPTTPSPTVRSPKAKIPLGAGTMTRSPPPEGGWI